MFIYSSSLRWYISYSRNSCAFFSLFSTDYPVLQCYIHFFSGSACLFINSILLIFIFAVLIYTYIDDRCADIFGFHNNYSIETLIYTYMYLRDTDIITYLVFAVLISIFAVLISSYIGIRGAYIVIYWYSWCLYRHILVFDMLILTYMYLRGAHIVFIHDPLSLIFIFAVLILLIYVLDIPIYFTILTLYIVLRNDYIYIYRSSRCLYDYNSIKSLSVHSN